MKVLPLVNTRGIPGPAGAQNEDLERGYREPHRSQNLLSARGNSSAGMNMGSQIHWRLDIRDEASDIGGEILRF